MYWFFLALVGPFLYALTNHIDKILLDKFFKNGGVGTILILSSLLSIFAIPFFYWADPAVLYVDGKNILVLSVVGILNVGVLWCYLIALKDEEASVVIVFYQLVPVFGYILGYFILGETLNHIQLISMATIILGTSVISFEINSENKFKLRRKTILPMVFACLFWATGSVLFKAVALEENVWRSLFWEHLMLVLAGICLFIFMRSYRINFLSAIRNNSKAILSFSAVNELLYILGNLAFAFSYMLAPVALVLLIDSFQPIFALIIGIFLTVFFPEITKEKIKAKNLWQKIIAISITIIGAYLLSIS